MATDLERFVEAEGRAERVKDVRKKIDAEGVTYIYYQFASVTGRVMGKGVPAPHWETVAQKGFQLVYGSTANLFTDRHGNYIGYGPEAWELVGIPEPETFQVLRGTRVSPASGARASATARTASGPGGVLASDCRGNLRRLQEEFEARTPAPPSRHRARDDVAQDWAPTATPPSRASPSPTATTSTSSPSCSRSSTRSSSTARSSGST